VGVQDKTVIINGLNECNGDIAQLKIMKLVAKSVIDHGNKILLLWAFFSQPELNTDQEFSSYSRSHFPSKIELSVSESNDGNIMHYFHNKLHPLSSANTMWPSEDTLNILVAIAAGLWIYAATIIRFIIDQGLPPQQLDCILEFHSQQMQSDTKSSITAKLDVFYGMIISHIFSKHLPIAQQSLLIHYITSEVTLHMLCNVQGLALENLKHTLSKLYSVLTLYQRRYSWASCFLDLCTSPSIMNSSWSSCLNREDQGTTGLRITLL